MARTAQLKKIKPFEAWTAVIDPDLLEERPLAFARAAWLDHGELRRHGWGLMAYGRWLMVDGPAVHQP